MSAAIDVRKNARETIRISRESYRGHDLINLRVFFVAPDGNLRPGKQGLAFKVDLLGQVRDAIEAVSEGGK